MIPLAPAAILIVALVPPSPEKVRAAAERAMPLLATAAATHAEKKVCFGCHNQAFPAVAFAAARTRVYPLDPDLVSGQIDHVREFLTTNIEAFKSGKGTGGQVDTAGWALHTLADLGAEPDDATAAVVSYLLQMDEARGYFRAQSNRPPSEASSFATTFVGVRGLQAWATDEQKERAEKRVAAARAWAEKTPARDTEDRVFRLRVLQVSGADEAVVRKAASELGDDQRSDGGWGQTDALPSDAYATGSALAALAQAGGWSPDDVRYRRGLGFLVRTQLADGSWKLKSRSKPFQPYYEGGFPHGKDQFISSTASGWAAAALWLAVPAK